MKLYRIHYQDEEYCSWLVYVIAHTAYEADQTFKHYRPNSTNITIEEVDCASAVLKTHKCVLYDSTYEPLGKGGQL